MKKNLISIKTHDVSLEGFLHIPEKANSIIVFVHGSGSSRHSPRNQAVAGIFAQNGFGTLLFDLLTPEEAVIDLETRELRFNIPLLDERVRGAIDWLQKYPAAKYLKLGLIGSSTGAAAALIAAAKETKKIKAVVSRGGRPDLAGHYLNQVQAPTLLIVGEYDTDVIELNKEAFKKMNCEKKMELVPEATHLFEEPGTLQRASELAVQWFLAHLH